MASTKRISSPDLISPGISSTSGRFAPGTSTVRIPAVFAARIFSFNPPMGSTRPRRVISPVMATSARTGIFVSADSSAVAMVIPAEGPSFGTAPSGIWMWKSLVLKASCEIPYFSLTERI